MNNIKNIIILITLTLSFNIYSDYEFSIKGGLNYSMVEGIKDSSSSSSIESFYKTGGVLFLSMKKSIKNNFYYNINLGINQKGGEIKITDNLGNSVDGSPHKRSFYTIEIPLILGYNIFENINLYIGVYKSIVYAYAINDYTSYGAYNKEGKMMNDFGFLLGVEYNYNDFLIDFRFQQGFGNLKQPVPESSEHYTNSRQFVFMVGYRFF